MKVSITEEQHQRVQSKIVYESILDDIVFKLSLITEDGKTEPDMEWDLTKVKKDIDLAKTWVQTKEDAEVFVKKLIEKMKNLSFNTKRKILKYVLYSFIGLLSINQISSYLNPPLQKAVKAEKEVVKQIVQDFKIRNASETLFDHLKYEEGSIREKGEPVLTAYDIGDGAYTIGYGHAIFAGENEGYDFLPRYNKIIPGKTTITKENAETLLKNDIKDAEGVINRILDEWEKEGIKPKITQGMYDAMVSMAFNMGPGIRTSDFIQALKRGDMIGAKELIGTTSSHLFNAYPGLEFRRQKEQEMFI